MGIKGQIIGETIITDCYQSTKTELMNMQDHHKIDFKKDFTHYPEKLWVWVFI